MSKEIWKEFEMLGRGWSVSSFGNVKILWWVTKTGKKSFTKGNILKPFRNDRGYLVVKVTYKDDAGKKKSKRPTIHRLVCTAFHPNPENKPQVNHKDGNPLNNRADNLEWATAKENTNHAWETGLCKRKWELTKEQIDYIVENYVRLGNVILAEEMKLPKAIVLKYAKKYGADIEGSLFKKVIDTSSGKIYNSVNELIDEYGDTVKNWRRRLSNERKNKTPFRYIDNRGNITEAKIWENKPRPSQKIKKPIAIFDSEWNFIEKFDYPLDLTVKYRIDSSNINDFLKGKRSVVSGYKFKLIDESGNYMEPIPFISKKKPKIIRVKNPVTPAKKVMKYDINGTFICEYQCIRDAANSVGKDKKQFRKQVTKSPTGYASGFNWKVID